MPWSSQKAAAGAAGKAARRTLGPGSRRRPAARSGRDFEAQPGSPEAGHAGRRHGRRVSALIAGRWSPLVGFFASRCSVQPDEQGVVLRFGEYMRQLTPGLKFRWPYPIETVYLPPVTSVNRVEVGMRGSADVLATRRAPVRDVPEESLMLTGDENIVDVDFVVFWRIKRRAATFCSTSRTRRRPSRTSPRAPCARSSARTTSSRS